MLDCPAIYTSAKEAKAEGEKFYFTGIECKHGHISKRYAVNGDCFMCRESRDNAFYKNNRESRLSYFAKKYEEKNAHKPGFSKIKFSSKAEYDKSYKLKNAEKIRENKRVYAKKRKRADPVFALRCRISCLIGNSITARGFGKKSNTSIILGCDWQGLKVHIERQFVKGMTWENRAEWHVDHIVPLASAKTEEDIIALNHYTNLRPMWAKENQSKGATREFLI